MHALIPLDRTGEGPKEIFPDIVKLIMTWLVSVRITVLWTRAGGMKSTQTFFCGTSGDTVSFDMMSGQPRNVAYVKKNTKKKRKNVTL